MISETLSGGGNLLYIRESLSELFFKRGSDKLIADNGRITLVLTVEEGAKRIATEELSDKIADVIAVGYKYKFFDEKIMLSGLTNIGREFLLAALISADLDEDKKYIRSKFSDSENCAIDGFFNFRLKNLKKKWEEIVTYIPNYFNGFELKEFIGYLLGEKHGKTVVVDGNKVYDRRYNRLKRVMLIPEMPIDNERADVFREVLLSGASEVRIKNSPPPFDEKCLKEYFGENILFNQG